MTFLWRNSKARLIVISDLESTLLPLHDKEMSAEVAWNQVYKTMVEFENVPFDMFEARLKEHRKQVKARLATSLAEEKALAHDRRLYPRQTHNHRDEPVFDLSPAKECLREDVKNKVHTTMSSSKFQESRPEYRGFKRSKFRDRIPQEVRRQKFVNYLDSQRSKKFDGKGTKTTAKTKAKAAAKTTAKTAATAPGAKVDVDDDAMGGMDDFNDAMDES
jgi:hypothetical protein